MCATGWDDDVVKLTYPCGMCVCVLTASGAVYTGLGDGRVVRIVDGLVENVTQFGLGGYAAMCSQCVCG